MFSKLFLSERDLERLQQALTYNPLLASLLMTSPIDAFKFLNLMPRFFDVLMPAPAADARLVQDLVRALEEGRTVLDRPRLVQPDEGTTVSQPALVVEPGAAEDDQLKAPDIALSISKATLQRAVQIYAESNFKDQEFVFSVQRWLDVNARGESIALDLAEGRARIHVKLRGTFSFRSAPGLIDLRKLSFPIELDLLARLDVEEEDRLFLSVSAGEMSILNPPLPERVAADLVEKIAATVPSIPLVQVPTRFEIPGDPVSELVLRLSSVGIDEAGLKFAFYLHD